MTALAHRTVESRRRLLLASYHCYIDPSSGAAISARELLGMLAALGWKVRTFCGPLLDFEHREDIRQLLADQQLCVQVYEGGDAALSYSASDRDFSILSFRDGNIRSAIFLPADGGCHGAPSLEDGSRFLSIFRQSLEEWHPDILLTYGGYWLAGPMLDHARTRGIRNVFWLRNFAYRDAALFDGVDCVLVPSKCSADYYRKTLGLNSVVIPSPVNWDRVLCTGASTQRYVTFVNPQPHKGVFWFARIAEQLNRLRPDIPLLIVEGRAGAQWLERTSLDLSGLKNLHAMRNTPDPRDFYRVSRLLLMPSLWRESFGRVAAEAMLNGIPVLGSRRGALPELLNGAGFLFDIPPQYQPESRIVPSAEEVTPWVETIVRLWDDQEYYEDASRRCRHRAEQWRPGSLAPLYHETLERLISGGVAYP